MVKLLGFVSLKVTRLLSQYCILVNLNLRVPQPETQRHHKPSNYDAGARHDPPHINLSA